MHANTELKFVFKSTQVILLISLILTLGREVASRRLSKADSSPSKSFIRLSAALLASRVKGSLASSPLEITKTRLLAKLGRVPSSSSSSSFFNKDKQEFAINPSALLLTSAFLWLVDGYNA